MLASGPQLVERARAKINLSLSIRGKRPGGYHEIESLVAFADAADVITVDIGAPVGVSVGGPFGPSLAGENLVRVTLDKLKRAEPDLRLGAVTLEKNLPIAAGIGGGSADAAAVMRAVRQANPDFADRIDWMELAASIGADVPVCYHNGAAIMRGVGDKLQPLDQLPPLDVVLVNPQVPVPADKTARVFRALNAGPVDRARSETTTLSACLTTRTAVLEYMRATGNGLLGPARSLMPEIGTVMDALQALDGAELIALSGGGPTCFAVFKDAPSAERGAADLRAKHPAWWIVATRVS